MVDKSLGLLFPVCDSDEKHFARFYDELTRLGLNFTVYFDHCNEATKKLFTHHPLYVGSYSEDDPSKFFDESVRQAPLNLLIDLRFKRYIHMDVDETLERDAPRKLREDLPNTDVVWFPCLDLWGDERHYRIDGVFNHSGREKVFKIEGNTLHYPHPTSHAPNVCPIGKRREDATISRFQLRILHWGIMNNDDAMFHKKRWDEIYTRKVGANPYGSYEYYFDPTVVPEIVEVPKELL